MTTLEREVGKLEARMETVEAELHAIRDDVRQIRDALVGLRGGWLALVMLVTASTTIGAMVARYLPTLQALQK
jgi:chromosome condensin MukBEF ATPase and DNA-binding subunit MukB